MNAISNRIFHRWIRALDNVDAQKKIGQIRHPALNFNEYKTLVGSFSQSICCAIADQKDPHLPFMSKYIQYGPISAEQRKKIKGNFACICPFFLFVAMQFIKKRSQINRSKMSTALNLLTFFKQENIREVFEIAASRTSMCLNAV